MRGWNRLTSTLLLVAFALLAGAHPAAATDSHWRGRTLADALDELRRDGLPLISSSDLVPSNLLIEYEPTGSSQQEILEEILAPHGLTTELGPGGHLLVVRRNPDPISVTITSPRAGEAAIGRVLVSANLVSGEPIDRVDYYVDGVLVGTLTEPPFQLETDVGLDNRGRRFEVVAVGRWGARGRAAVESQRYTVEATVEVSLRQIPVTVMRAGHAVDGLGPSDFEVVDDGVRQQVISVQRGELPVQAVLLIDASQSMQGPGIEAALDGVAAFVSRLEPTDLASVVLFSDRPRAVTPFSSDGRALLARLDGATASGATALNDHLFAALQMLDTQRGRPVIVLLSDGADVVSVLSIDDVRWKIGRSDALLYWIRLPGAPVGTSFSSSWRDLDGNQAEAQGLEDAVIESGGRVEEVAEMSEIGAAFDQILRELRRQYLVGYYPTPSDEASSWRPVEIRVRRPGARARYRRGYDPSRGEGFRLAERSND